MGEVEIKHVKLLTVNCGIFSIQSGALFVVAPNQKVNRFDFTVEELKDLNKALTAYLKEKED